MFHQLKIKQLDRRFKRKILLSEIEIPRDGWIKEIRTALKMTYAQVSKKLSVTPSAIMKFEKNEIKGTINITSMNKIAEALNCKFVYALVPNETLNKIIDNRVEKVATKMINQIDQSMSLENQSVNKKEIKEQLNNLKKGLKNNLSSKIWNYEV
jgi:predicted DNA-binding mobile mystery protein A